MAVQANPDIRTAAHDARVATKRLSRSLREAIQALAILEATCERHGIKLEIEDQPQHSSQENR